MLNLFSSDAKRGLRKEHVLPLIGAGLMLAGGSNAAKLGGAALAGYGLWRNMRDRDDDATPEDTEKAVAQVAPPSGKGFLLDDDETAGPGLSRNPFDTQRGSEIRSPDDVRWTRRKPRGQMADPYADYPMQPPSPNPPTVLTATPFLGAAASEAPQSGAPMTVRDEIAAGLFGGPAEMATPLQQPASMPGNAPRVRGRGPETHGAPNASAFMGGRMDGAGNAQGAASRSGFMMGRRRKASPQVEMPSPSLLDAPTGGQAPTILDLEQGPNVAARPQGLSALDAGDQSQPDMAALAAFGGAVSPSRSNMPTAGQAPNILGRGPNVAARPDELPAIDAGDQAQPDMAALSEIGRAAQPSRSSMPTGGQAPTILGQGPNVAARPDGLPAIDVGQAPQVDVAPLSKPMVPDAPLTVTAADAPSAPTVLGRSPEVNTAPPQNLQDALQAAVAGTAPGRVTRPRRQIAGRPPMPPRSESAPIQQDFAPNLGADDPQVAAARQQAELAAAGRAAPVPQQAVNPQVPPGNPPWLDSMLDHAGPESYGRLAKQYAHLVRQGHSPDVILKAMEMVHPPNDGPDAGDHEPGKNAPDGPVVEGNRLQIGVGGSSQPQWLKEIMQVSAADNYTIAKDFIDMRDADVPMERIRAELARKYAG